MWICSKCKRTFKRTNQQHSCKTIPLEQHFKNKPLAKELFNYLTKEIDNKIGSFEIISLPCCIHLFGNYDFLAVLPYKDRLEIRFASEEKITSSKVIQSVNLSQKTIKYCVNIKNTQDVDYQLLQWLKISYNLKNI